MAHAIIRYGGGGYCNSSLCLNDNATASLDRVVVAESPSYGILLLAHSNSTTRLTMTNSTVEGNDAGIYAPYSWGNSSLAGAYEITVTGSTFRDNGSYGILSSGGTTTVSNSSIYGHSGYGVYNANTTTVINAENNYWGAVCGPAPYGTGNGINYATCYDDVQRENYICQYYVDADPWLPMEPETTWLAASPASSPRGGTITLYWRNLAATGQGDYVVLYGLDGGNGTDINRKPATGSPSGAQAFVMPGAEGTYEFRYLRADGSIVAVSNQVSVLAQGGPSLFTAATQVTFGDSVTVYWDGLSKSTESDWIGLFDVGATDTSFRSSQTISGTSGSVGFTMPATPGTFEFRLFADGSSARLTTSSQFTVAPYRVLVLLAGLFSSSAEVGPTFSTILDPELSGLYAQKVNFSYNDDYDYLSGDTLAALGSPSPYGLYQHLAVYYLHNTVARILADHPHAQIDLMGHSLGGVVAFLYLKEYRQKADFQAEVAQIKHLITLDSPLNGAANETLTLLGGVGFSGTTIDFLASKHGNRDWLADNKAQGHALATGMVIRTVTSVHDRVVITAWTSEGEVIVVESSDALLPEFQVPLQLGYAAFTGDLLDAQLGHGQVLRHPDAIAAIETALMTPPPER